MCNLRNFMTLVVLLLCAQFLMAQVGRYSQAEIEKRVDAILSRMTLEEKIDLLGGMRNMFIRPIERVGIPALKMSDGPLGVRTWGPTTGYPAGIAVAASWDTDLAHRVGASMGKDARARGVNFLLGPGMNIYRAPMAGRNFEYLGEDPYLASRMAVAIVKGVQEQGVIATIKHFAGNNQEYGRTTVSSDIDERTLREIYLPAFEAAVKEGKAGAIMDAYNLVNGVYMTENQHLNTEIAKKEWGFDGIIMSDWGATHDGIAAANGGLDLEMPSGTFMNRQTLIPAIQDGKVSTATIDDKVRRILRKAVEFGFFDRPQLDSTVPLYSQEGRQVALEAARASMVLLKNSGNILPLDKTKLKSIAVIGPTAYPAVIGGGGSSEVTPFRAASYLIGISDYLGPKVKVLSIVEEPPLEGVFNKADFVVAPDGETGMKAEYFNNEALQGPPALVRTDKLVNFQWGEGSYVENGPVDHFSARWTGYFVPKASGDYKFYVSGDDGYRLYLDDQRVINDWQKQAETVNSYAAHLEAGKPYRLKLEYYEETGGATVAFGVVKAEDAVGKATTELAAKADAVIVCVGFDPATETEGSDRPFQLTSGQDALIKKISSVNRNTIVVVTAGGNVDMTGWIDTVPALIQAWYPGQEGGTALAQLLFGDFSPSGKLPASFERKWEDNATFNSYYTENGAKRVAYKEGVFLGYRHFDRSGTKPMFPFGFGLSYTTFEYRNLAISPRSSNANGPITVTFDVTNTGKREGAEVAQLYVSPSHSSVERPVKELKGFAKVNLKPGETKKVTLALDKRAFSYYDVKNKAWTAEPGDFTVLIGSSAEDLRLKGTFTLVQ